MKPDEDTSKERLQLTAEDDRHASSYWQEWGRKDEGYGTQRKLSLRDLIGVPLLALTSPDRLWVMRQLDQAVSISRQMGLAFTQDSIRQLCTLGLLRPYITEDRPVLIIGDGFGTLAGLIGFYLPTSPVYLVDLSFALYQQMSRLSRTSGRFKFAHAESIEHAFGNVQFGCAININSMQEMNPPEVARYFAFMRGRVEHFYCCNRVSKTLPDGTVTEFTAYP